MTVHPCILKSVAGRSTLQLLGSSIVSIRHKPPTSVGSMIQIQLNLPESAFSALRSTPDEFGRELLIAAVVKWYEVGMISQSKAAEIAGISRQDFLTALNRFEVSPFQTTPEELEEELSRG